MAEFTPHPYQRRAFRHVTRRRRSALYLEMGLGKTVVALTAVQHWRNTLETHKTLVLGGKRVVRDVWPAEIEKWDHIDLTYSLVVGDAAARRQALKADADLYLMNYENLQWLDREKAWEFDTLILDESPALKKPGGKRRRALLRNLKPDYRMIQLTGTPSANGLQDLWGQVHLMDGGKRLGRTYGEYRDRHFFLVDKDTWRYKPREGAMEEITGKLADICLSMRSADYIELPPKIENVIETDLPPRVRVQYEELQEELILELKKGATITAPHTGT